MKATGIVRRIDDLGRVVIPKEIRRTLRLREGTPLEIFTDREGEIILKKYSPMMELTAVSGGARKELLQKTISRALEQVINDRAPVQTGKEEKDFVPLVDEELEGVTAQVIAPIICEGDAIGAVALMSREPRVRFGEMEMKLAVTAAGFLGRQMEG